MMINKEFWNEVKEKAEDSKKIVKELFDKVNYKPLNREEALICLNALFIDTHARIKEKSKLAKYYPTTQCNPGRLIKVQNLWWVDHFTGGLNAWNTLNWFSNKLHAIGGKKKKSKVSTHFVIAHNGEIFYIVPITHGTWHEPQRNRDSISVEMVNVGKMIRHVFNEKEGPVWCRTGRKGNKEVPIRMPRELTAKLPPQEIEPPYKGAKFMQPFTQEQVISNIKIKRIVRAATGNCLERERMSQHSDWKEHKYNMGPLWLLDDINDTAFEGLPIEEQDFMKFFIDDFVEGPILDEEKEQEDFEDLSIEESPLFTIENIQSFLNTCLGLGLQIDGRLGPKTKAAIIVFQKDWNRNNEKDKITVDGRPGVHTWNRMQKLQGKII